MATTISPPVPSELFVSPFPPMRMSLSRYHDLISSGIFTEDDRIELLDGLLVEKMPKNAPHRITTHQLDRQLNQRLPPGWHVQNQDPVTLESSEPEPDLAIVRGTAADYPDRHPGGSDVALVVEVADTTLTVDRRKAGLYAAAGIPEYWLVDLVHRCVEVYRLSQAGEYGSPQIQRAGQDLMFAIENQAPVRIAVADILPPLPASG